jgi:predicted Zn-dependent peptidase
MIDFERYVLNNGLTVLIHQDKSTPLAAINILYKVGSRDEQADKTGFAHLFEHLMFSGSANVKDFDEPIQNAGGENNAFTNTDLTNYYEILPAENLETALWLESDRLAELNINANSLEVQRKVVIEEFKEVCLNQPYGDAWHKLSKLAYKKHPYQWPTIGKEISHIEEASLSDVQSFFNRYYTPGNAILSVAGPVASEKVLALIKKWFEQIPSDSFPENKYQVEPLQDKLRSLEVKTEVPMPALYMAFHAPGRLESDYYASDILSDALSNGRSSRLYQRLVKQEPICAQIDAYISGSKDPGLFIIEARPNPGQSLETIKELVWKELDELKRDSISLSELKKLMNKLESSLIFGEVSVLNKAINLGYYEFLGDANLINKQAALYQKLTPGDIQRIARKIFRPENCSYLSYYPLNEES